MNLPKQAASAIVARVKGILGCDVNIMDKAGIIIASTDPERINTFHKGAATVLKTGKALEIGVSEAHKLEGSRAGINLPISLNRETVGVVGLTGEPSDIRQYGELVQNMVEVMISQSLLSEQLRALTDARKSFIFNILHGNLMDFDEDTLEMQGKLFGYDMSVPRYCIVVNIAFGIRSPQEESDITQHLTRAVEQAFGPNQISAYMGNGYFVVLAPLSRQDLLKDTEGQRIRHLCGLVAGLPLSGLEDSTFIGIGRYHETLGGLHLSYEDAMKALRIGKLIYRNPILRAAGFGERVYSLRSLGICSIVGSLPSEAVCLLSQHCTHEGDSLTEALGPMLTCTLVSFFLRNLNLQRTAEAMYIHRNTLSYRLDRVRDITGKDARNFQDAMELCLVLFHELISSGDTESDDKGRAPYIRVPDMSKSVRPASRRDGRREQTLRQLSGQFGTQLPPASVRS